MPVLPRIGFVWRLATLVAVAAIPFVLLAGLLLRDFAERTQSAAESYVLETARNLSVDVDREIDQIKARLDMIESLFTSGLDVAVVDQVARAGLSGSGLDVVAFSSSWERRLDTGAAPGTPLPKPGNPALHQLAIDRNQKQVSNVFRGPLLQAYLVAVSDPIRENPAGVRVASIYMRTDRFLDLLGPKVDAARQVRWALIDRDGRYIARSDDHDTFVGTPLAPHLRALSEGSEGLAESLSVTGVPVMRAFRRSPATGWVVAVSIPTEIVYAEMREAWTWFFAAGILLAVSAAFASFVVAHRLKGGLTRLGEAAARIGHAPLPDDPSLDIREFARIYANMQTSGREIRALAERRDVLLRELVHRSRNMLTVVLSVVHSAFRQYDGADQAKAAVIGRISALALANELVTDDHDPIDLRTLVCRSIDAFAFSQFSVDGPNVGIGEETAQRAALLIHELCTNATKYGALSTDQGHVLIRWFHPPDDADSLVFTWTETGGPPVAEPVRRGYGTRLILASAFDPDQPPTLKFEPFGLRLRMVTPVASLSR